ncbi:unnamed protein product [Auanema sp. JU1783]|nr:unnamed protein product [Auanema sp. JU1783]
MGQQHSGFVVEIASPRLGRFQAVPQKDPDEKPPPEWRITVNPAAELFGSHRLKQLIDRLYHHQKLLTPTDARQLLSALYGIDPTADLLLPLLTVISNSTAYPANQVLMRDLKLTERIVDMLCLKQALWPPQCRLMLLQCVANMAVCPENLMIVKPTIPIAISRLSSTDETEVVVALQALTNLSLRISSDDIPTFVPCINACLNHLWVRGEANINALRLLVNLSCCPDLVPYMLGAKPVTGLIRILDSDRDEILLRGVTWLLCTSSAVEALNITYDTIASHNQDPFSSPTQTLFYSIFGAKGREEMITRAIELRSHNQKDIAQKSQRLLEIVSKIPLLPAPGSHLNRL